MNYVSYKVFLIKGTGCKVRGYIVVLIVVVIGVVAVVVVAVVVVVVDVVVAVAANRSTSYFM